MDTRLEYGSAAPTQPYNLVDSFRSGNQSYGGNSKGSGSARNKGLLAPNAVIGTNNSNMELSGI